MPHTPITIGAAAPKGAPRRLQFPVSPETEVAPPCRTEALMRGALLSIPGISPFFVGRMSTPVHAVSNE